MWVNKVEKFYGESFHVSDLRFQSSDWTGKRAPNRLNQARQASDNPASREWLRAAVANTQRDVLLYHNLVSIGSLGLPMVQYIHNFRPFSPSGTMWVRGQVNASALRGNPWHEVIGGAWERSFPKTLLIASYQKKCSDPVGLMS